MRAQPDRLASGPSGGPRPPGRPGSALATRTPVVAVCVLLVVALVYFFAVRSPRAPEPAAAGRTATQRSTPTAQSGPPSPKAAGQADDAGLPSRESAQAAAAFVDAWLTKDRAQRLARLKVLTVTSLYQGLTFTDPQEIPSAHRVGRPRVEDAGSYLVRYRVALSNGSEVLVSSVYEGNGWLVGSIEPSVG
jgi:hypothetical protein